MSGVKLTRTNSAAQVPEPAHAEGGPPEGSLSVCTQSPEVTPRTRTLTSNVTHEGFPTSHNCTSDTHARPRTGSPIPKLPETVPSPPGSTINNHSISPHLITPHPSEDNDNDSDGHTQVMPSSHRLESTTSDREETEAVELLLFSPHNHAPFIFPEILARIPTFHRLKWFGPLVVLVCACMAASRLWREQVPVPQAEPVVPPIPLRYMAWSISSNALYLRDTMLSMHPIQQIGQVEFNTIALVRFATEIETIGYSPITANRLRDYVNLTKALKITSSALNARAGIAFRDITQDLSKADKLRKKLYPHHGEPARPRNLEVEAQLLSLLHRFLTSVLPTELRAVSSRFRDAGMVLRRVSYDIQQLEEDLATNGNELAERLQVIPLKSSVRVSGADPRARRRTELYQAMVASFERAKEVEGVFLQIELALSAYSRSLPLFQSPNEVGPDHHVSNATLQGIVSQIGDVMPQIQELVQLY